MANEWVFEKNSSGDWIGRRADGRRTALKGSLSAAQADAKAGRVVCRQWPSCDHYGPEGCMRAIAEQERRKKRAA